MDGSEKVLEASLKTLKAASLADLYVAVGNGNTGPKDVVHAIYRELRQAPRAPRMLPALTARARAARRPRRQHADHRPRPGDDSALRRVLHPLPGDRIVGIVTTGKGVTIHTKDCQTLDSFAATPERYIDVDWEEGPHTRGAYRAHQRDRRARARRARELANAVSKHDGAVTNLKIVNRQQDFFEILVDVEVRRLRHWRRSWPGCGRPAGSPRWIGRGHDPRDRLRPLRYRGGSSV
ncbi:MAG: RelA/SpoT AH/RIS domain-containing protein [Acetobacteraceae bacterium]